MRNLILVAVLAVSALASCMAGADARNNILTPAIATAWDGVRTDVERGIADAVEDGDVADPMELLALVDELDTSISDETVPIRAARWSLLRPFAERGIQDYVDDGVLGSDAIEFLEARLEQFDRAMLAMQVLPL